MMQEAAPAKMDISVDMLATNMDPNCGMKLTTESIKDTAVYEGKLYGFCSSGCKESFKKDPQAKLSAMEQKMKETHQ
ncbi:MAG: YHS domain-containing protein [Calditrichaeota bacterium]|nr:YHS domain-containing protein [Calditrichota bacterium]